MTIENELLNLNWTAEIGDGAELIDTATKALNEIDRIDNIITGAEAATNFNRNITELKERREALRQIANKALARYDLI